MNSQQLGNVFEIETIQTMNILFIAPNVPYPLDNGGRIRVHALIKHLAANHQVDLIAFDRYGNGAAAVAALRTVCRHIELVPPPISAQFGKKRMHQSLSLLRRKPYQYIANYSPEMQRTLDRYLASHHYDIIQVEFSQMAYYRLPDYANCVLDQHNVEYEILYRTYKAQNDWRRRLYSFIEWQKFRRDEIRHCRQFPLCITTSARDRQMLQADAPATQFRVVPNGVDCAFFQDNEPTHNFEQSAVDANALLFTGTIDYHPNTDGLLFFLEQIFPRIVQRAPAVKFYIVGRNPPPVIQRYGDAPNVIVTGRVEDVRPYFARAAAVVVPLRTGGGTRLKILEAMAMGKPVISTRVGAEGIEARPGTDILLADDPDAFARTTVDLLQNGALRERLAGNGRALVTQKYDWKMVAQQLEQAYSELLSAKHSSSPGPHASFARNGSHHATVGESIGHG